MWLMKSVIRQWCVMVSSQDYHGSILALQLISLYLRFCSSVKWNAYSTHLLWKLWEFNELIHVKCLQKGLAQGQHLIHLLFLFFHRGALWWFLQHLLCLRWIIDLLCVDSVKTIKELKQDVARGKSTENIL